MMSLLCNRTLTKTHGISEGRDNKKRGGFPGWHELPQEMATQGLLQWQMLSQGMYQSSQVKAGKCRNVASLEQTSGKDKRETWQLLGLSKKMQI